MSEEESKEMELRFLRPVEKIPSRKRARASLYDSILKEFIESSLRYALVEVMDSKPVSVTHALKSRLKKRKIENIKVLRRKDRVYLEKLE